MLMIRSKASKDSSRGFQVSSEISFLISVQKTLPTFDQTVDVTPKNFFVWELNGLYVSEKAVHFCASSQLKHRMLTGNFER